MSNSKNRRQTPAQRAAAQRRTTGTRPAPTPPVAAGMVDLATFPRSEEPDEDLFDLDAVAHEAVGERFRFKAGPERRIWEMRTPEEVDWQENSTLSERATGREDLRPVLRLLLGEEQYEDFLDLTISTGQVSELLDQWRAWHGIELPESGASRR